MPWEVLEPEMRACQRCHLSQTRTQVVTYRGADHPWLLIVGEAPGREEDRQGRPFVGRAGSILDRAVGGTGLTPQEWGVTNVVMCRPPGNRFDREAARACRPWLASKVASLAPSVVVTLGTHALESFLPSALPMMSSAGKVLAWEGGPLFPMLHPAATLRSKVYKERWEGDWARFRELLPELRPSRS
jgi:uracil-DNA glycosylase